VEEIKDILHKKLKNESLSHTEVEHFSLWISSTENKALFNDYKKVWELTNPNSIVLKPNVDMQWERFKQIRNTADKPNTKIRLMYQVISAVAAVAILVIGISVLITNSSADKTYTALNNSIEIILPDNTKVHLNTNSELIVYNTYNKRTRTVKLTGEALFDVEKNQDIPFIVEMEKGLLVKVLGTSFSLRTYNNDEVYELKVLEGKVLFEKSENSVVVEKNEQVEFNHVTHSFSKTTKLNKNLLAWHTKVFEFDNTPINDVALALGRYINKPIQLPDNLSDIRYTGTFNNASEQEIAEVLALALGWNCNISKNSISFTLQQP
jgi:ferric-dicitrate binding protein FerR (iron transport regulator)